MGDLRMAVATFLAGAAESNAMQDRDVIADDGRFADHQAGRVIEEDALADARSRVDIRLENAGGTALQIEREITAAAIEKPMRETMGLQRLEALEIENGLHETQASRIAVIDRLNVDAQDRTPFRPIGQHFSKVWRSRMPCMSG